MSLKYRDSQGNEAPVAGLNGTSGELVPSVSYYQTGTSTESLQVGYSQHSVSFSEAMPDTDYIVTLSTGGSYGSLLLQVLSKTKSGFTFSALNENAGQLSSPEIKWQAFKLMTDESRVLDETHIEQNTANFAPSFSTLTSYAVGDYVTYNNILYRCTTAHTAGVWVAGHFTQVTVGSQLKVQDISPSITMGDGYASGQIYVFRDGNTVQVLFNSVVTTGYSKTICSGLPKPLHSGYFCVQADADPQELGLAAFQIDGSINSGTNIAGMAPSKVWDGFITYLTRD